MVKKTAKPRHPTVEIVDENSKPHSVGTGTAHCVKDDEQVEKVSVIDSQCVLPPELSRNDASKSSDGAKQVKSGSRGRRRKKLAEIVIDSQEHIEI